MANAASPFLKQRENPTMATPLTMISPDKPTEAIKTLLTVIVERAGGEFVGIQDAFPEYGLPAYVLFIHQKYHVTLALRLDENFGTEAILKCMDECEKKFRSAA